MVLPGVLLLVIGAIFPLALLLWLGLRLNRRPALRPRQVGLLLALNLMLPVSMVLWGLQMISPRLAASAAIQTAAIASSAAAVCLVILMAAGAIRSQGRRAGGGHGR